MTDDEALAIIRARRGTMYDPAVVDMFERVCRDIGPMTRQAAAAEGDSADHQGRRLGARAGATPVPAAAATPSAKARSRCARWPTSRASSAAGRPPPTCASLIWSHVRHVVPNASCAFFVSDPASDSVKVAFVAGDAASMLQGLEMKIGERLTGWVAENQQPIVNSEATLDLGSEAVALRSQLLPRVAARRRRPARRRAVALRRRRVQGRTGADAAVRDAAPWADVPVARAPQR